MKKYSIIYADPPWAYRTYSKKGQGRSAESHYPTMCIEEDVYKRQAQYPQECREVLRGNLLKGYLQLIAALVARCV